MFKNPAPAPVAESSSDVAVAPCDHPIPLTHLALDIGLPPLGWADFLGRRGIKIVPDTIGRDAISSHDARGLLEERRADEIRRRKLAAVQEAQAVADDQERRAQIWRGAPASSVPPDLSPAGAMLALSHDARPKRQSVLEHALSNDGSMVFHPFPLDEAS